MKRIIISCIMALSCYFVLGQEKYHSFIVEVTRVYDRKFKSFRKESEKAMKDYLKFKTQKEQLQFDFMIIPELLLKKSRTLYNDIDSTDIVQYFDPCSMFYHQTLVITDSSYVGNIISKYPIKKNEYNPKPTINAYIYDLVYKKLIAINPDIVFTVQNIGDYFFIKDNELFALTRGLGATDNNFIVYQIGEYTEIFKEYIFAPLFRYEPRIELIVSY